MSAASVHSGARSPPAVIDCFLAIAVGGYFEESMAKTSDDIKALDDER